MFIRKSKVEAVLGEMRERAEEPAYVKKQASPGYLFAIADFERLLQVRGRRPGTRQVQKAGDGATQIQVGGSIHTRHGFAPSGAFELPDPALDWPDRYPDGGQ